MLRVSTEYLKATEVELDLNYVFKKEKNNILCKKTARTCIQLIYDQQFFLCQPCLIAALVEMIFYYWSG